MYLFLLEYIYSKFIFDYVFDFYFKVIDADEVRFFGVVFDEVCDFGYFFILSLFYGSFS